MLSAGSRTALLPQPKVEKPQSEMGPGPYRDLNPRAEVKEVEAVPKSGFGCGSGVCVVQ